MCDGSTRSTEDVCTALQRRAVHHGHGFSHLSLKQENAMIDMNGPPTRQENTRYISSKQVKRKIMIAFTLALHFTCGSSIVALLTAVQMYFTSSLLHLLSPRPRSIKTSVTMQPQALNTAVDELKLMEVLPLNWLKFCFAPRTRQVVLRNLWRWRGGVPIEQTEHVASGDQRNIVRANS